ncbi:MAG TPA: flagellar basal-body MS-ring/collar protein FliF [Beijerinckiaceae bacterium]
MNAALEILTKFGPGRLAAMGATTLALIGFFAFVILRVSQPAMGVLYSDLSPQDAAAVVRDLETRGIAYEARGDGQTILAPKAELPKLRMDFAGKGLPSGGGVGYEIFDKGDAFSSTSFVQGINHLRALEGELSRTIRAIGRVQAARVHLVIPERRLFERDREAPRASIVLKLRGELESGQVRAVRHLVASAVEGLKPERVSIIDEQGRLLADGAQGDATLSGLAVEEKQTSVERRLRGQVEEIVARIVGQGRARVQVAAELDLNRVESRQESYDPESKVVRSTQTRSENQSSANGEGQVSVGNELPGANAQGNGQGKDASNKNEEVINYEISRTTRTEVLEGGRLKRLSVAVLVDGVYAKGTNGEPVYQPRPQEELDRIAALVRSAIGFDRNRGDQIEVVNLRFAEAPQGVELKPDSLITSLFTPTKEDVLRLVELGVLAILTLIVLLAVVRPMLRKALGPEAGARAAVGGAAGDVPALAPPAGSAAALSRDSAAAKMIELAKVNGEIQADSLQRIGEMVKTNPSETVAVLRQWIHERS